MNQQVWNRIRRMCPHFLHQLVREERGANMIIFALGLMVMMGLGGLAIDGSNAYYQQQRMQIAADSAALGGARALANGRNTIGVDAAVQRLGGANGADTVTWTYINGGRGVHVTAARNVPTWFARIYNVDAIPVSGESQAQYEAIVATDNLLPMTFSCNCINGGESSFEDPDPEEEESDTFCPLLPIAVDQNSLNGANPGELVEDIWNGTQPGNFGWLSWTGETDAGALEDALRPPGTSHMYIDPDGNQFSFNLDDVDFRTVLGLTGVTGSSGVRDELEALQGMDIMVPTWESTTGTGSNASYNIVGFAMVRLEDFDLAAGWISITYVGPVESCNEFFPGSTTIRMNETSDDYRFDISFMGKETVIDDEGIPSEFVWRYRVTKRWAMTPVSITWGLDIPTCVSENAIISSSPPATGLETGSPRWTFDSSIGFMDFTIGFANDYVVQPSDVLLGITDQLNPVQALLTGPNCGQTVDGTDTSDEDNPDTSLSVCIPKIDFETDDSGGSLVSGHIIDNEWAAWGLHVITNDPVNHPAMIFDSSNPTGNDPDLGAPHQDFAGPGEGAGGAQNEPGENAAAHGKTLIVSEDGDASDPDDNADGGQVIFTFDIGVRMDEVQIMDIADMAHAGTVRAYSDVAGANLLTESYMLGLGENSFQTVPVNATGVRRLEIDFPASGSIPAIISCRDTRTDLYKIGDVIWDDADNDGLQDNNEPGIAEVVMELYVDGQGQTVGRTRTNSRGVYRFENLPPGTYFVKIAQENFESGGVLEGSVLTSANAGTDTQDSDFNGATLAVTTTLPFNGGDNYTLDGGVVFAANSGSNTPPETVTVNVGDVQNSTVELRLVSQEGRTWTYSLREVSGKNLRYWQLAIDNCGGHIVGSSPPGSTFEEVGRSGIYGLKWDIESGFTEGQFSFTLDNDYAIGAATALVSTGTDAMTTIKAPNCSVVEGDESSGGESEDGCNFRWVDWDGSTGTNLELADNIMDPSNSGKWRIGRVISPGPAVANSTLVSAALNNQVGDEFVIPLTEWTGVGYQICGFARVRLLDYDLSSDPIQMSIQFLKGLARSGETDPSEEDYGARDLVFID